MTAPAPFTKRADGAYYSPDGTVRIYPVYAPRAWGGGSVSRPSRWRVADVTTGPVGVNVADRLTLADARQDARAYLTKRDTEAGR